MASRETYEGVAVGVVGLAAIAILLSKSATTSGVLSSAFNGIAGLLGAALSPSEGGSGVQGASNQSLPVNPNSSASLAYAGAPSSSSASTYTPGGAVTPQNVGSLLQQLSASSGAGNPSAQAVLSTVAADAALIQGGSNSPGASANTSTAIGGGSVGFSTSGAVQGLKAGSLVGVFGGPVGLLAGSIVGALLGGFIGGSTPGTVGRSYTGEQTYGAGQSPGDATGAYGAAGYGQGAGGSSMSGGGAEAGNEGATGGSA